MIKLRIGLLSALIAAWPAAAASNLVELTNATAATATATNNPVELELKKLMAADDAAAVEVDGWIRENHAFAAKGAGIPAKDLNARILKRLEPVRKGYEDFIRRYPTNAEARVAFASFLNDLGDEDGEAAQLEKARELDPKDPAVWNNLANYYGHRSPVKKAFAYYAKAIELDPHESVYYQNLATTVYLFRKDAKEYYHLTEKQVFDKAMGLYDEALKLDPTNFPLATDLAMSYYGIRPMRTEAALRAWTNALDLAHTEVDREGIYIHFARIKMNAGRFDEAQAHLNAVTNSIYADLKNRLLRNLKEKKKEAESTNALPENVTKTK